MDQRRLLSLRLAAVTWLATGRTISSTGPYAAPSAAGTYTVQATSTADTTKWASGRTSRNPPAQQDRVAVHGINGAMPADVTGADAAGGDGVIGPVGGVDLARSCNATTWGGSTVFASASVQGGTFGGFAYVPSKNIYILLAGTDTDSMVACRPANGCQ